MFVNSKKQQTPCVTRCLLLPCYGYAFPTFCFSYIKFALRFRCTTHYFLRRRCICSIFPFFILLF